ncbi:MAG: hypothetical protein ABI580_06750 [Burkholderiaceae bacterium]
MAFDPPRCAAPIFVPQSCKDGAADEFDETSKLQSALAGDEAAFTVLYPRHGPLTSRRMCSSSY